PCPVTLILTVVAKEIETAAQSSNRQHALYLQSHHIDEDSQHARHCLAMLRWSVVHSEIFINAGWENNLIMINTSTPRVALNLLATVFKEHPNDELRSIATT
ncbi:17948_t:CDS:2, partial [Cetraspora pellucida]